MSQDILSNMGFNILTIKESPVKVLEQFNLDISVTKPDDHKHPQMVFKLPRLILNLLKWEITDRVKIMTKSNSHEIALIKAPKKEPNTFAISVQGASLEKAKNSKRGGVVKVGWRNSLCKELLHYGTHTSISEVMGTSLIIKLPQTMFDK